MMMRMYGIVAGVLCAALLMVHGTQAADFVRWRGDDATKARMFHDVVLAPGESVQRTVTLRNPYDVPLDVTLRMARVRGNAMARVVRVRIIDVATRRTYLRTTLARAAQTHVTLRLRPREVRRIVVRVSLSRASTNDVQGRRVRFDIALRLTARQPLPRVARTLSARVLGARIADDVVPAPQAPAVRGAAVARDGDVNLTVRCGILPSWMFVVGSIIALFAAVLVRRRVRNVRVPRWGYAGLMVLFVALWWYAACGAYYVPIVALLAAAIVLWRK